MNTTSSRFDPATPSGPAGPAPARAAQRRFTARRGLSVRRTRAGGWWVALVAAAFMLLLLLIFVLQNGGSVRVSFLGAHGNLPLGIALLLAATAGVLIVAVPGSGRIIQLRRLARRREQSGRPDPSTSASAAPHAGQPAAVISVDGQVDGAVIVPDPQGSHPGQPAV